MKLKFYSLIFALFLCTTGSAQWLQRANFPGIAKAKSTAFTIGNKIYVLGGVDNAGNILGDFWVYDIPSNTWTQNPNFPGPERYGATSFVINNKGYVATGGNDFGYLDDLWEFDPLANAWTQKTGLPAGQPQHENQRVEAYSFVIGNKAYLGGGEGFVFGPNSTNNIAFYDIWEYNPVTDGWTQKAGMPDFIGRDLGIGVAINNKGYVGLGCNVQETVNHQGFWEYDPVSDAWTAKANFPTTFTVDASAFVLNSTLYVAGGVNLNPVSLSSQFYKYNPVTDTWTLLSPFNGGAIAGAFTVSTAASAFMGTGYHANLTTRNDLWEFTIPTGLNENNFVLNNDAIVSPNPANDFIIVKAKSTLSGFYSIYDITGRSIQSSTLTAENQVINISELPAGLYFIKIEKENHTYKFLKK